MASLEVKQLNVVSEPRWCTVHSRSFVAGDGREREESLALHLIGMSHRHSARNTHHQISW